MARFLSFQCFTDGEPIAFSLASVDREESEMCIINQSPEIHFHQTTTLTPEQFIAGLTNFGPGRSKLFGNSADEHLKVHRLGPSEADVTEGSNGIWERLHYDWSDPNRVVLSTIDSNLWSELSGHIYTFTRQPNGTTEIDAFVVRDGKNFKGRVLGLVLRTIGRGVLKRSFEDSVRAIEARNYKSSISEITQSRTAALRSAPARCTCAVTNNG